MKRLLSGLSPMAILLAAAVATLSASESPRKAFARKWEGRIVVVKQILYTLVYNERGLLGNTYHTRHDGLVVVTPFEGIYYQFDGRQSRGDVTTRDPQQILAAVSDMYQGDSLDVRSYQRLEPMVITQYDVGVELLVKEARVDRDMIRLSFVKAPGRNTDEAVTTLTIRWPVALSESLTEQDLIETLIDKFVEIAPNGRTEPPDRRTRNRSF